MPAAGSVSPDRPPLRRRLTRLIALLAASLAVWPALAAATPGPRGFTRIGAAPTLEGPIVPLAAVSSVQTLRVTVALSPRHAAALAAYAQAVADPSSPSYGRYLTERQFVARYAPSTRTITLVRRVLTREGLSVRSLAADHLSLDVVAPAGRYEAAMHLVLAHVLVGGRAVLVNRQAPAVPDAIAPDIQAIIGLDGLQTLQSSLVRPRVPAGGDARSGATSTDRARTMARDTSPAACPAAASAASGAGAYTAGQIAGAYSFNGLYGDGDEGAGVTIGVYELESDDPNDIAAYQSCYGTSTSITYQSIDGGAGSGAGSGEAAFDIEQLIGLAPQAKLIVYQGPNSSDGDPGSGPYDTFASMISQDKVSVITNSWGECESVEGATDAHAENTLFEEAAVQGQTVVSASGDDGSEDCYGSSPSFNEGLAVDDPGSQPFVTDVGGTSMSVAGPPPTETVWNAGGSEVSATNATGAEGAGGGGISSLWTMPAYQSGAPGALNVINNDSSASPCGAGSGDCREVPDVSADADPQHGYVIYYNGAGEVGTTQGWQATGGTSGAAPLWAAVFALADADPACGGQSVGFVNPALYRAAASGESTFFNDVTSGNNDFTGTGNGLYPATPGYDMATGLGSPDVSALAAQLCRGVLRLTAPAATQSFVALPVHLRIRTVDATGVSVAVTVSGLPAGVRYDASTQEIIGTPRSAGVHTVRVTASDSSGTVRSASFSWSIAARPALTDLMLGAVAGGRPVLSLRASAGRAEAPLSTLTLTLPAGLAVARSRAISVRSVSGATPAHSIRASGRRVTITLRGSSAALDIRFGVGALKVSAALVRQAARRVRPSVVISASIRDVDAGLSSIRSSVRAST